MNLKKNPSCFLSFIIIYSILLPTLFFSFSLSIFLLPPPILNTFPSTSSYFQKHYRSYLIYLFGVDEPVLASRLSVPDSTTTLNPLYLYNSLLHYRPILTPSPSILIFFSFLSLFPMPFNFPDGATSIEVTSHRKEFSNEKPTKNMESENTIFLPKRILEKKKAI
ncbi:unnamed protein product [Acanthosepion pharaonis]|uniref:Uncharacterized protein n=1 Tax=Acanthosepion pharaonis TaxID=158019 RepID=A0A812CDE6_ACAPH|nr:unnamed protein product [Sepia pharaonis]